MISSQPSAPILVDTTLREGEQTPGLALSFEEKVRLASLLMEAGIREIEAGMPAMGGSERRAISHIVMIAREKNELLPEEKKIRILTWNRLISSDIEASLQTGATSLYISAPVSPIQLAATSGRTLESTMDSFKEILSYLNSKNIYTACGLQDATRTDPETLRDIVSQLTEYGAKRIRISDTVGILTPGRTADLVRSLQKVPSAPLEIHTHNDFGMATANALTAYENGISYIDGTILGLGERAGNARLEELTLALKEIYHADPGIHLKKMVEASHTLIEIADISISPHTPVLGKNVFSHESGIHVAGIIKDPASYEPFPPEEIGVERSIVIGKHSGRHSIEERLSKTGIAITREEATRLLKRVRDYAAQKHGSISDQELLEFYKNLKSPSAEE